MLRSLRISSRTLALTVLALFAFAGNSLLCRLALKHTAIDAASFTTIRLVGGAVVLALLMLRRQANTGPQAAGLSGAGRITAGNWPSALALFAYAAAFSFAYIDLTAASGALLLFGAVQATMVAYGLWAGERLHTQRLLGLLLALAGLVGLLLPGVSAPPWQGAVLMVAAGIAWGVYSLRGKGQGDALAATAGNFIRTVPMAAALAAAAWPWARWDAEGALLALVSGAVTSALGYAIWYAALPALRVTTAAVVQLSVPVITAVAGVALLAEPLTLRLMLASAAVLGGIGWVVLGRRSG